ncbi:uncharacterized protein [Physcomitrium patens]|uniref:Uncharacterized protein n=1 Tax=Physcomitrium patens TaxID=3218 RepID=A9RMD1_PHYPA|nr:trichohyalin-like [Physcomitrium patens]XP_024402973.1 trichohyalin-like [Physcomitrium patens]XP_024402974.1 trichohyalin-like [Physcomitrium patens]PNR34835.1 hypothetical protein PHYPA_022733 [Physcomitrium patens]|eukprot:XP_024402972.1 trichohyalin-like [Physcomitrella patens]
MKRTEGRLQESRCVDVQVETPSGMAHSPDCSYAKMQCRKAGLKRRRRISDRNVSSPVKVERLRSASRKVSPSKRLQTTAEETQEENRVPLTPGVSYTQNVRDSDVVDNGSHESDFLCRQSLLAELRRRNEVMLAVQRQRNAAIAEGQMLPDHECDQSMETELLEELRRTNELIESARKQRDDAIAPKQLQLEEQRRVTHKASRDLTAVQKPRDDACKESGTQSRFQLEDEHQIQTELPEQLLQAQEELKVAKKERDGAVAEKHSQLERQCDHVFEIEMGLRMELQRVANELETTRQEREKAILEVHLDQEHLREQIRQIELELRGAIQQKVEELKVVKKERDAAIREKYSQLELQCDQITEVEMELQRDLQEVLEELQSIQEERDTQPNQNCSQNGASLQEHFDKVREIEQELAQSREKLNCLRKQYSVTFESKLPSSESWISNEERFGILL